MRKLILILLIPLLLVGCIAPSVRNVEPSDVAPALGKLIIIDVRTPEEVAGGYIEGAIFIDYNATACFVCELEGYDKEAEYLIYCKAGGRSAKAAGEMAKEGFKRVYNLMGGYEAWVKYSGR